MVLAGKMKINKIIKIESSLIYEGPFNDSKFIQIHERNCVRRRNSFISRWKKLKFPRGYLPEEYIAGKNSGL